ncbi:MAG: hypothetical protein L0H93_10460 [Nocardioides sp.]|nr:hypothetical protein [Nocardioides sp.]
MTVDVQRLVEQGYWRCSGCSALLRPGATECRFCHAPGPTNPSSASPVVGAASGGGGKKQKPATPSTKPQALNPEARRGNLGSLAELPSGSLTLVVHGLPVQQGSLVPVAPGVVKRDDGPKLVAWRDKITREALRVCGSTWVAPNAGVRVDLVFTVNPPESAPTTKPVPADGYRDLDKLSRAVGDALCPSIKPGTSRFRVLASDMRINGNLIGPEKTHPRPLHTHPWALDQPGVVIRLTRGDLPVNVVESDDGYALLIPCPDPNAPPVSDPPLPNRLRRGTS